MLTALGIRKQPFYNTRHRYITYMLSLGVAPLFVVRRTGTSVNMIETDYGGVTAVADELDGLIRQRQGDGSGNPAGTLSIRRITRKKAVARKATALSGLTQQAGDRGRTGDVQLGKIE